MSEVNYLKRYNKFDTCKVHPSIAYRILNGRGDKIQKVNKLVRQGKSFNQIAKRMKVSATTVSLYYYGCANNCLTYQQECDLIQYWRDHDMVETYTVPDTRWVLCDENDEGAVLHEVLWHTVRRHREAKPGDPEFNGPIPIVFEEQEILACYSMLRGPEGDTQEEYKKSGGITMDFDTWSKRWIKQVTKYKTFERLSYVVMYKGACCDI